MGVAGDEAVLFILSWMTIVSRGSHEYEGRESGSTALRHRQCKGGHSGRMFFLSCPLPHNTSYAMDKRDTGDTL